jgi:hypothetical protein
MPACSNLRRSTDAGGNTSHPEMKIFTPHPRQNVYQLTEVQTAAASLGAVWGECVTPPLGLDRIPSSIRCLVTHSDLGFYPPYLVLSVLVHAEEVEDEDEVIEEETSRMSRSKMWFRGNVL